MSKLELSNIDQRKAGVGDLILLGAGSDIEGGWWLASTLEEVQIRRQEHVGKILSVKRLVLKDNHGRGNNFKVFYEYHIKEFLSPLAGDEGGTIKTRIYKEEREHSHRKKTIKKDIFEIMSFFLMGHFPFSSEE